MAKRQITVAYLEHLLRDKVPEGQQIEYKSVLPGKTERDRFKYLSGASSFANSSDGIIFFGVSAEKGIPISIPGIAEDDIDSAILRLESILRDNLTPTLPGIHLYAVGSFELGPVIVLDIRKSWIGPHMITLNRSSPFYVRTSAGVHPMDIEELRSSFLGQAALPKSMREFRLHRNAEIVQGRSPVSLRTDPYLLLHIMPLHSFISPTDLPIKEIYQDWLDWIPFGRIGGSYSYSRHINFDGLVTYQAPREGQLHTDYCQLFRNGIVEACNTWISVEKEGIRFMYIDYEKEVVSGVRRYVNALKKIGVEPPYYIFITGNRMKSVKFMLGYFDQSREIDREAILIAEVESDGDNDNIPNQLKPIFDQIANAFGVEQAFNYDENGQWRDEG